MILTNAVAGIARSGATRSGYPVLQGATVKLYALSNVARSGATRANYTSSKPFISIGGSQVGWGQVPGQGVIAESLTKSDAINTTPVTLAFTAYGWVPVEGADVIVTLGSKNNLARQFGGTIVQTRHRYASVPRAPNMFYDVSCIDYTWALDNRKVSGNYTGASVAAIAASLMTFAPAGYTLLVDADIGAEVLDQITMTEQTLTSAFAQLAKRVGGDFLCDYSKVVHLFFENTQLSPPAIVNAVHPSLATISFTRDLSQVITRCLGNFGGSNALDQIAPGAPLLPVDTAAWYLPAGGTVLVGQQRVTHGGIVTGGGGALVGPGAAPTGAPNVSLQPGVGVDLGTHDYSVTFITASGETLPGPRVTVPVGVFLPPTLAPTFGHAGPGATGPDPGAHDWAVSFVISSGETVPGPRLTLSTDLTVAPETGPTPDRVDPGPGPDPGVHDYAVTFGTATGETTASPIGGSITTGPAPVPPPSAPAPAIQLGTGLGVGAYGYATTFVSATGETAPSPTATVTTSASPIPPPATPVTLTEVPVGIGDWALQFPVVVSVSFVTATGETTVGPSTTLVCTQSQSQINVSAIPLGPPGTVARYLYRPDYTGSPPTYVPSGNVYRYLINDNTTTTYTRLLQLGSLYDTAGHVGPPTNTAGPQQAVAVASMQTGPTGTTARRLYRTVAGGSALQLVTTIGNNTATTYTDTTPDASLGATAPTSGTWLQTAQTVHLASVPRGTAASGATARKIYRRSAGAGLRYVATIPDNSSTTYTDTTPNASLGAAPPAVNTATLRQIPLTNLPLGNSLVTARKIYRTVANAVGGPLKFVATLTGPGDPGDSTTTSFLDTVNDASLGAAALTVGTAQAAQVALTSIPLGASSVTARKLYRTKVGLTQLQLLTTLADNFTTLYLDTALDSTLGANPPTSDTSTLQQPTGNVLAGSPTLPVASVAAFLPTGGWAIVGSQNLRYTGISGNALLGIPATGPGAIGATITYNTTAVAAAMLTGIPTTGLGVIKYTVFKGDPVNVFVQVDDLDAQAAVRAQLPGSDGIIEDEIQDGRLSYLEGRQRCQARLDLLGARDSEGKVGIVTVSYVCRDLNTHAGATVTVNLGPPINLRGDYLIQRVSVAQFNIPHLNPTYSVEASSLRFSAEEMLRLLRQGAL